MKNLFRGYYKLDEDEFKKLWKNSIFIFDTNVLLNLYRYQATTRVDLFEVIEKLSARVWIPFHVGLEFQRNRLSVIAEQHKRFLEVRKIMDESIDSIQNKCSTLQLKTRHSHINPDKAIEEINKIKLNFFKELDNLEKKSISISSDDEIRKRIDKLFDGKIGAPPKSQKEMEELFSKGESRYQNSIPPGFKDSSKEKSGEESFTYGGITYKKQFGDFIIWEQILQHVKESKVKDVIYITDDTKSDWWWQIESSGQKTIGPRPELVDELQREAGVDRFHIYTTESFLSYANNHLGTKVAADTLEEVREVSFVQRHNQEYIRFADLMRFSEKAVYIWLSEKYNNVEFNHGFPDFCFYRGEHKYGFDVKAIREPLITRHKINEAIYRAYHALNEENFFEIVIVLVFLEQENIEKAISILENRLPGITGVRGNIRILFGRIHISETRPESPEFIPYHELAIGKKGSEEQQLYLYSDENNSKSHSVIEELSAWKR